MNHTTNDALDSINAVLNAVGRAPSIGASWSRGMLYASPSELITNPITAMGMLGEMTEGWVLLTDKVQRFALWEPLDPLKILAAEASDRATGVSVHLRADQGGWRLTRYERKDGDGLIQRVQWLARVPTSEAQREPLRSVMAEYEVCWEPVDDAGMPVRVWRETAARFVGWLEEYDHA